MKASLILFILLSIVLVAVSPAEAKVLPRHGKTTVSRGGVGKAITIYPRLRADRKALTVAFGNLSVASSVSYTLTYQTDGKQEGISGSVDVAGGTVTRELLFGTCSSGVCRYHTNLSNMKLEVETVLTSGKRSIRRFRVKI